MDMLVDLMAFQQAYKQALHTLYNWETDDVAELLPKAEELNRLLEPVLESADRFELPRKQLRAHASALVKFLKSGEKDRCLTDIRDIVFYDMPNLADQLLGLAGTDIE